MILLVFVTLYRQNVRGFTPVEAGVRTLPLSLASVVAGAAGGLQATALQIDGALGTSVLVSLISSRVGSTPAGELTAAGVPAPMAEGMHEAKDAVAMGISTVSGDMPGQLKAAVIVDSGQAFINGVHTAALVTEGVTGRPLRTLTVRIRRLAERHHGIE